MQNVTITETGGGVRVETGAWIVEHRAECGGAWTAISPMGNGGAGGLGRNLLTAPMSSALHCLDDVTGGESDYRERYDTRAKIRIEATSVIAEGVYRNARGEALPVGYRRRTEYAHPGLIWTTLEIMSDCGCPDVVELSVAMAELRSGLRECHVALHPSQAGQPDLLGARGRFSMNAPTAFYSRFTPLQMLCADDAGAGIEFLPGCDLAGWDGWRSKKGEPVELGLGMFRVGQGHDGYRVELSPYCLRSRRIKTTVQGHLTFKLGIALGDAGDSTPAKSIRTFPITGAPDAVDFASITAQQFDAVAIDTGAFEAARFGELIEAAHAHGLKILATVSAHEFPLSDPEYAKYARAWMHTAAPSLGLIQRFAGAKAASALMCLNSGWREHVESQIGRILTENRWDGIAIEQAAAYPCCHPSHAGHGAGPFHSDLDGLIKLLSFCRKRSDVVVLKGAPRSFALCSFTDGAAYVSAHR